MASRLCVLTKYLGGRSETFIEAHAKNLLPGETCLAVAVAAPEDQRAWDFDGPLLVLRHPSKWVRMAWYLATRTPSVGLVETRHVPRLLSFLKENGCTHVLSEYLDVGPTYIQQVTAAGLRWNSFGHGYDVSRSLKSPFWQKAICLQRHADGVFVRSGVAKSRLEALGVAREKIVITPGGVSVAEEPVTHGEKPIVRFLHVGRLVGKKGLPVTIRAFARVLKEMPDAELQIIGSGPEAHKAQGLVGAMGLGAKVRLLGAQPPEAVEDAMRGSDVFVLHSRVDPATGDEEGLPTVILEAMGQGLPVVSTLHGGIPEAVVEGETGLLVAENDIEGMATAMVRLGKSSLLRAQMGAAGYERAKAEFTWKAERARILGSMGLE